MAHFLKSIDHALVGTLLEKVDRNNEETMASEPTAVE
jgi:hypothetical protein